MVKWVDEQKSILISIEKWKGWSSSRKESGRLKENSSPNKCMHLNVKGIVPYESYIITSVHLSYKLILKIHFKIQHSLLKWIYRKEFILRSKNFEWTLWWRLGEGGSVVIFATYLHQIDNNTFSRIKWCSIAKYLVLALYTWLVWWLLPRMMVSSLIG